MAEFLNLPGVKGNYAVGLSWRHEDVVPKGKQLRELASNYGRWGVVYSTSGGGTQIGLCNPIADIKTASKLKALASIVADAHQQPWRGVYDLGNGRVWYIAVRDGQEILINGDQIGTRSDIAAVYAEHEHLPGWTVYEGRIEDLAEIVKEKGKQPSLKDFAADYTKLYYVMAGVAVLAVAGLGVLSYLNHQHNLQLGLQRIAQMKALQTQQAADAAAKANFRPWSKMPVPSESLAACQLLWGEQAVTYKGWVLGGWECHTDETGVTMIAGWERQGGVAADAPGALAVDGNHSVKTDVMPQTWQILNEDALPGEAVPRMAWTFAQQHGVDLTLAPPPPVPKAAPDTPGSDQAPPPPWQQYPASFKLMAAPWLVINPVDYDAVTGLRLQSVKFDAHSQMWAVDGQLYGMLATGNAGVADASVATPVASAGTGTIGAPLAPASALAIGMPASSTVVPVAVSPVMGPHTSSDTGQQPIGPVPSAAHVPPPAAVVVAPTSVSSQSAGDTGGGALAFVKAHQGESHAPTPPGLSLLAPTKSGG